MTALAPTVEASFTQQLAVQRDASPHRRRLSRHAAAVLVFARNRTGTPPSRSLGDIPRLPPLPPPALVGRPCRASALSPSAR